MHIHLLPKDPSRSDLTCLDGEIDFFIDLTASSVDAPSTSAIQGSLSLTPEGTPPERTVRIALQSGERQKAELMLSGQISRVDPATAERLTQEMVEKAAELLLGISTDFRRQGLFILPFRCYTMMMLPDGTLSCPSPQAVALPADYPPHPEITAATVTDDCLTLALRFPVRPHRLTVSTPADCPEGYVPRLFISYPLYIPDPKEMRGSLGSVRSAAGGQATGIRFAFLSESALKASVAAPEKYHEMVGNGRTGYRISSKAAASPDYSVHAAAYGYVRPFPRTSLLLPGDGVGPATDPLDWIADWVKAGDTAEEEGYLPASLPYKYHKRHDIDGSGSAVWPDGIDAESAMGMAEAIGATYVLLTRPMCFAESTAGRHKEPTAIRTLRVAGLPPGIPATAILYGSDDCVRWTPIRRFDPRIDAHLLTPPRHSWRLLLMGSGRNDGCP